MAKREPLYQNSLVAPVYHTATYVFEDTDEVPAVSRRRIRAGPLRAVPQPDVA